MHSTFTTVGTIFLALQMARAAPQPASVTDIAGWKHPTKAVLDSKGISLQRVDFLDKTWPVFHVRFPVTAGSCDTSALSQTLREVSQANGYWTYTIVDSTAKSVFLKAVVFGDRKNRSTSRIDYLARQACFSEGPAAKSYPFSLGAVEWFDRSKETDVFEYELKFRSATARFSSGAFGLDDLKEIAGAPEGRASSFLLATFSGPGMNCREQYRVIRVAAAGKIEVSDSFGFCSEIVEAKRQGESLRIRTSSEMEGVAPATFVWRNGNMGEEKAR